MFNRKEFEYAGYDVALNLTPASPPDGWEFCLSVGTGTMLTEEYEIVDIVYEGMVQAVSEEDAVECIKAFVDEGLHWRGSDDGEQIAQIAQ